MGEAIPNPLSLLSPHALFLWTKNERDGQRKEEEEEAICNQMGKEGLWGLLDRFRCGSEGDFFLAHHKDASGAARLFSVKAK